MDPAASLSAVPVPVEQLALMGAITLLPMVPAGARGVAAVGKSFRRDVARIVKRTAAEAVSGAIPVQVVAEVGGLSTSTQEELSSTLTDVLNGKQKPKLLAQRLYEAMKTGVDLSDAVKRYDALRSPLKIEEVLNSSVKDFTNSELSVAYQADLTRLRRTPEDFSPMEWSRGRRGRNADILRRALGENVAGIMRFIEYGTAPTVAYVPEVTKEFFNDLSLPFGTYDELESVAKGHGRYLERDHLVEKRFFLNHPMVESAGGRAMFDEGMCVLVPKNYAIAEQLGGVEKVLYVHADKRPVLQRLLPTRGEHLYSVQNIWDAHVFFYNSLSLHPNNLELILGYLETDMTLYAQLRGGGERFIARSEISLPELSRERFSQPHWWTRTAP